MQLYHHHLEILFVVAVAVVVVVRELVSGLGLSAWSRADFLIFLVLPLEF